jgi:hypothetical protein
VDQQAAEDDCGRRIARNAQAEQRNESAAGDGVVGGLRRNDAFLCAFAEAFTILGEQPRVVVGDEVLVGIRRALPGGAASCRSGSERIR